MQIAADGTISWIEHPGIARHTPGEHAPRPRDLVFIVLAALVLRLGVFVAISAIHHLAPAQYANLYDGRSYLIVARALLGDRAPFNDYDGRVFPGFPAMVALGHRLGLPLPLSALGIDWVSAAAAAALAASLLRDRRIGWAMACLIPHYLMNSTMAMTEAPMLALSLAALVLAGRGRSAVAGALMATAALVRPMACFAALGLAAMEIRRGRWKPLGIMVASALVVGVAALVLLQLWRGDALAGYRYLANSPAAHGGMLISWPFRSLLLTPAIQHESWGRVLYIWAHAVIVLLACACLARRLFDARRVDPRDVLCAPWLWANTLFVLCIGSIWGFECFHRFAVPAQPAMFWALGALLPRRAWPWAAIAAASVLIAVFST